VFWFCCVSFRDRLTSSGDIVVVGLLLHGSDVVGVMLVFCFFLCKLLLNILVNVLSSNVISSMISFLSRVTTVWPDDVLPRLCGLASSGDIVVVGL